MKTTPSMTIEKIKLTLEAEGITLSDDLINEKFIELFHYSRGKEACGKCLGIKDCSATHPGMVPKIEILPDGQINFSIGLCSYEEKRRYEIKVERLLSSSRLPPNFRDKTFENFVVNHQNKRAYNLARKVAMDSTSKKGLVLQGAPGIGKSHLAMAIMNYRIKALEQDAVFCTTPELFLDIRRAIRGNQDTSELIELIKHTELFVLDDLGVERVTDFVVEMLYILVNGRLLEGKQTIVTTNYSPSDLIKRMAVKDSLGRIMDDLTGKRIVSRLKGECVWEEFQDQDWRLKKDIVN